MRNLLIILAFLLSFSSTYAAAPKESFHAKFAELPMLHEGRMKPLSSFAGIMLRHIHGKPSFGEMSANQWLATLTLSPEQMVEEPLFQIKDKRLLQTLNISENPSKHYSFMQLYPALHARGEMITAINAKDKNQLNKREAGLLALADRTSASLQLSEAFSLIRPISPTPSEALLKQLNIEQNASPSYLSLLPHRSEVDAHLKQVIASKGEDISHYSAFEKELAGLSFQLAAIDTAAQNNNLLRIIPTSSEEWVTPWQLVREGKGNPENIALLNHWRDLIIAYQKEDMATANAALGSIHATTAPHVRELSSALELESLYHAMPWKQLAIAAYLVVALLCIMSARLPAPHWLLGTAASLGFIAHSFGITLRMLILERPPVSTLYESVLFVAWVAVLLALLFFWRNKQRETLLTGTIIGALLLLISPIYVEGDSLEMLVAVLNTNIWLATHVIIITMGYGASVMAASLAHLHLWKMGAMSSRGLTAGSLSSEPSACRDPAVTRQSGAANPRDDTLTRPTFITLLIAAALTTIGTILGGIWADQSWGRFWGWDPKENGALLIVLWITWLLHARITKQLSDRMWYGLLAALNIIVALSWFGVNLLGVGLHSYGFTESAVYGLAAFCLGELLMISFLIWRAKQLK